MQRLKLIIEIKSLFLIINVSPLIISAQITRDFEKGDLSGWSMSTPASWDTSSTWPVSGNYSLWHSRDNSEAGKDIICLGIDSLRPDLGSCRWEFSLRHGYPPSSANCWMIFLMSDMDTKSPENTMGNAIAVEVNYEGSDDVIELIAIREGVKHSIINTGVNWEMSVGTSKAAYFKILRETDGTWTFRMYSLDGVSESLCDLSGREPWLPDICSFGIRYQYSSRQDRQLWFDDLLIDGVFERDTIAPFIAGLEHRKGNEILLEFTEEISAGTLNRDRFILLEQSVHPDSMSLHSGDVLYLRFETGFIDEAVNTLVINEIKDRAGNASGKLERQFFYYRPKYEDLIINEVMVDPDPPAGLPEYEYVELYNSCPYEISTLDWVLFAGDRKWILDPVNIPADKYLIITHRDAVDIYREVACMLLFTSISSLANTGTRLRLIDERGDLISELNYSASWYTDEFKSRGGWSLERIDPDRPCGGNDNWASSIAPAGGTPGYRNSVYALNPDRTRPGISNIFCPDSLSVEIEFTELMDPVSILNKGAYSVNHGIGSPERVVSDNMMNDRVRLVFNYPFRKGMEYLLGIEDNAVLDCSGNSIQAGGYERFGLPEMPGTHDILFNEILFNPLPGCDDYLELYNNSQKIFDLFDLWLSARDMRTSELQGACWVSQGRRLLYPAEYIVLNQNPEILEDYYYVKNRSACIRTADLPSMGDKEGHLVLMNRQGVLIDELHYKDEMHFSMLDSWEGISLERISFSPAARIPDNWHSASETSGFGTPGYANSQQLMEKEGEDLFSIGPRTFSPDNDGYQDVLSIRYSFDRPGNIISIMVFDPRGRLVCSLANNELAGTEGIIAWNGTTSYQTLARTGMYLILIEVYDLSGRVTRMKDFCILR